MTKSKKKYIGTVTEEFKTSKGVHKVGSEYDCKDEFSYKYLLKTKKIK